MCFLTTAARSSPSCCLASQCELVRTSSSHMMFPPFDSARDQNTILNAGLKLPPWNPWLTAPISFSSVLHISSSTSPIFQVLAAAAAASAARRQLAPRAALTRLQVLLNASKFCAFFWCSGPAPSAATVAAPSAIANPLMKLTGELMHCAV